MKRIGCFLLRSLVWIAFPATACAGISAEPGIIEMIAARGDEAKGVCKITNTGKDKAHISAEPEDWRKGFRGERGQSVSHWLSVSPQALDLDSGQTGYFTYDVKVAPDAAGEYAAQIFFSQVGGGETQIQTRVGVVLYMAIRETMNLDAEAKGFDLSVICDGNSSVVNVQVKVANTGNVHVRPTGDVKIYDHDGTFVMAIVLNTGWGILPGEDYAYQGTGRSPKLKKGKYKAVATIQYGKLYKQGKNYTQDFFFEINADGSMVREQKVS